MLDTLPSCAVVAHVKTTVTKAQSRIVEPVSSLVGFCFFLLVPCLCRRSEEQRSAQMSLKIFYPDLLFLIWRSMSFSSRLDCFCLQHVEETTLEDSTLPRLSTQQPNEIPKHTGTGWRSDIASPWTRCHTREFRLGTKGPTRSATAHPVHTYNTDVQEWPSLAVARQTVRLKRLSLRAASDSSKNRCCQISRGVTDAETHAVAQRGWWGERDKRYDRDERCG